MTGSKIDSAIWHDVHDGAIARGADLDEAARLADTVQHRMRTYNRRRMRAWFAEHAGRFALGAASLAACTGITFGIARCDGGPRHFAGESLNSAMHHSDDDLKDWYRPNASDSDAAWKFDARVNLLGVRRLVIGGHEFWHLRFWDAVGRRHVCVNESSAEWYAAVCP